MRRRFDGIAEALHVAALLAVAGALAWATGRPLVFPSLGPSAYLVAVGPSRPSARDLVGGHVVGVAAGLVSYHALAGGAVITDSLAAAAPAGAHLAASAVASVGLTTAGMAALDARHAPACATTLIVSLGLLSSATDAVVVVAGVVALFVAAEVGAALRDGVSGATLRER